MSRPVLWARLRCWWRGYHEGMIQREDDRVFIRCERCGVETTGWPVAARSRR